MSHITTLTLKILDYEALCAACASRGIAAPIEFSNKDLVKIYNTKFENGGWRVSLPGWRYPMLIDKNGTVSYDNFNGQWGPQDVLDGLLQAYVVETITRKARTNRFVARTAKTADGAVRVTLTGI